MRVFAYCLLLVLVFGHLDALRRSSRRRESSSSSRSSSSYGSSSSSSGRKSFGTKVKEKLGIRKKTPSTGSSSTTARKSFGTKVKEKLGIKKKPASTGSSYPTQQWGSAGGTSSSVGGGTGIGGFSQPKPPANNFGAGTPIGGFAQPKAPSNNFGAGSMAAGGLAGAGVGGLAGSHIGGGGFSAPKPANSFGGGGFGNTNPGNNFGAGGFNNNPIGGGGFVQPKPVGNNFGGGFTNSNPVNAGNNFGGGFGNRGSSFGSGGFNTKPAGSGSNWKNMAGAGVAGGVLGGGVSQYSSFAKPKQSFGSHLFGGKKYGYKTPGYGTNWGTNFAGGAGQYGKQKKGISKKALGLGIGAGFLGGAALGVAGTMASYSVYHRYQEFQRMMHMRQPSMGGWDDNNYNNYYQKNECMGGCPMNSHCEWGFCECNAGSTRRYGRCESNWANIPPRPSSFDPFQTCSSTATCMAMDMNLICNTALTTQGNIGKCECRRDMKWNAQSGECQMYLDVDCSKITYETPPSAAILSAVDRAKMAGISQVPGETEPLGRTENMQESLSNSLLRQMDAQSSEAELREAFCRDIDAYSFEFQPSVSQIVAPRTAIQPIRDERPAKCDVVPRSACAVAYDSSSCSGGWKLVIPMGELRFRWFTSYFTYRNDMDTIGVRAGCTFTGYSDSSYNGNRIDIKADSYDRWVVFADHAEYRHMDSDIESVRCVCRN